MHKYDQYHSGASKIKEMWGLNTPLKLRLGIGAHALGLQSIKSAGPIVWQLICGNF